MMSSPTVVAVAERPELTHLAWLFEDEITHGTVKDLGDFLSGASLAGHDAPRFVYAPTRTGGLVAVPFQVSGAPYNDDDLSTATVSVELTDDVTVTASWTVDGRV